MSYEIKKMVASKAASYTVSIGKRLIGQVIISLDIEEEELRTVLSTIWTDYTEGRLNDPNLEED